MRPNGFNSLRSSLFAAELTKAYLDNLSALSEQKRFYPLKKLFTEA